MKRAFLILFTLALFNTIVFSQNDSLQIKKSTDKVIIGGRFYYVHIVKKGETLYSLSKAYNVSQKEIAKENPEIFLGLQVGQAIKIPVSDEKTVSNQITEDDFIYHKVKKGQTLYSLSKKYDVTQDDIITYNPDVRYGINIGQVIKIPKEHKLAETIQQYPKDVPIDDTVRFEDDFIYHTVEKKETIYSLTREYGVTTDELQEHNSFLSDGLKAGQILKIPKIKDVTTIGLFVDSGEEEKDTLYTFKKRKDIAYSDSVDLGRCDTLKRSPDEPYQIAVFLPFYLEKNDEKFYIDSSEVDDSGEKIYEKVYYEPYYIYPRSLSFVEFYEGFLLAVDSLKQRGLNVNLHVYDTQNDTSRIKEILNYPALEGMDLIIGPIYNDEVKLVSEFSKYHQINMVSPLWDNLQLVDENPNLFQVTPSFSAQIDEFARYVSNYADKNLILVHNGDSASYGNIQLVKDKLFGYFSNDSILDYIQFKEVILKDSINVLEHAASKEVENVFIVPSNDEAFVTNVVTKLNTLSAYNYPLRVCGLSRWLRFRNIDPEYYFNLNLCIATPYFVDYKCENVKKFILKYRDTFHTEPQQYAIHGYDVGLFFLTALMNYGEDFQRCIYNHNQELLQADYKFVRWYKNSGFENIGVSLVKYQENYEILKISNDLIFPKQFVEN
ncbi:MAG: LysM peptidoglycan-binding domain-containing protein [Bacteroidota bacterium]